VDRAALSPLPGVALADAATLDSLAQRLGGTLDPGLDERRVWAVAEPSAADPRCLAPVLHRRFVRDAASCGAVLLVDASLAQLVPPGVRWVHAHAAWAMACLLEPQSDGPTPGRHPAAVVDPGASLGHGVEVGAGALILQGAEIGDHCSIGPHAVVYPRVRIGCRVLVGAGAVLGRPGFGWVTGPGGELKRMPQLAGVVIEDDVEVGALATVDAGTLHPTVLAAGCRLDAHVHVGHNVHIGRGTLVAAQAGFAGSARIGNGVLVGGQAGVADHVTVGDGARLAGKAGVIGNVPPALTVAGYPAVERVRWLRAIARLMRGSSK
jgi:UDP-3-O-[3-hydroxymyristoyl] glucosamine N-acyltransferase